MRSCLARSAPARQLTATPARAGLAGAALVAATLSLAAVLPATAAEIFRWVDEADRVHYGTSIPDAFKQKARQIDTQGTEVSEETRREAEARAAKERTQSEVMAQERAKAGAAQAGRLQASPGAADRKLTCEEEWKRYRESLACFAPYRLATGGIRAEAFKKCVEVKQPVLCP